MADPSPSDSSSDASAAQVVGTLSNLIVDACRSDSQQALLFKILNSTIHLVHYDRAILWDLDRRRPNLLGISGQTAAEQHTRLAKELRRLVEQIPDPSSVTVLRGEDFPQDAEAWSALAERTEGLELLWLPIVCHGRTAAGLWLERWGGASWQDDECELLRRLADGYGAAWERFAGRVPLAARLRRRSLRSVSAALLAVVLAYVLFVRTSPLRLVAPCRVVPKDPVVVTAPLDGVVETVLVDPGDRVVEDELLFVYDKQEALQERDVARQQVEETRAELERKEAMAFEEEEKLSEIAVLRHRLAQTELRLALAETIVTRLEVRAPVAGVVMIDRPHAWRGRPVRTGERVVTLIDPQQTAVRIWLAQDDNVDVNRYLPVDVFLYATPHRSQQADVVYEAPVTAPSPAGVPSFLVEADWRGPAAPPRPGLKGTAVLYGPEATLAYWLARKPWSALRKAFGW